MLSALVTITFVLSFQSRALAASCDSSKVNFKNFDISKALGTWHEIYSPRGAEEGFKCPTQTLVKNAQGTVEDHAQNFNIKDGAYIRGTGTVTKTTTNTFAINYDSSLPDNTYYILGIDYDNFLVLNTCDSGNQVPGVYVFGRRPTLDADSLRIVKKILEEEGDKLEELDVVKQEDCPEP